MLGLDTRLRKSWQELQCQNTWGAIGCSDWLSSSRPDTWTPSLGAVPNIMCMFTKAASTYARANLYGMASLSTQRGLWGIAILRVVQSVGHSSLALGSP